MLTSKFKRPVKINPTRLINRFTNINLLKVQTKGGVIFWQLNIVVQDMFRNVLNESLPFNYEPSLLLTKN